MTALIGIAVFLVGVAVFLAGGFSKVHAHAMRNMTIGFNMILVGGVILVITTIIGRFHSG